MKIFENAKNLEKSDFINYFLINYLLCIAIGIIILNIVNLIIGEPFWQITRLIGVSIEGNFTTWFSSIILGIAGLLAYNCSTEKNITMEAGRIWKILSLLLLGMSCDETAQIHENLGNLINKYALKLEVIQHSSWVVILGPFVLLLMLWLSIKIKNNITLNSFSKKYLIIGLSVFVFGGFILEATINFLNHEKLQLLWSIEAILEEGCEMVGVIFFIKGLLCKKSVNLK